MALHWDPDKSSMDGGKRGVNEKEETFTLKGFFSDGTSTIREFKATSSIDDVCEELVTQQMRYNTFASFTLIKVCPWNSNTVIWEGEFTLPVSEFAADQLQEVQDFKLAQLIIDTMILEHGYSEAQRRIRCVIVNFGWRLKDGTATMRHKDVLRLINQ